MQLFSFLKREILALQEIPSKKCSYPGESVQSFFFVCVFFLVHEVNLKLCLFNMLSPWHQKGFGAVNFYSFLFFCWHSGI